MNDFLGILSNLSEVTVPILDVSIPVSKYCKIDLSRYNASLAKIDISNPDSCQAYIDRVLALENCTIAYGGYLEKRNLYDRSERFSKASRNIHLGMDFWCKAGTAVVTPLEGTVHSFANNPDLGNYGPTLILEHQIAEHIFYTLYGHLSLISLDGLYAGKLFPKGSVLAFLGETEINVNYAPHLHFQIIREMGTYKGDYPGVCTQNDLEFYQNNCPDPNILLKF
ncbi:MAG: peptidoglycan DD-metalloendopeptidase family protein [Bacteroidota bacterium]